MQRVVQDFFPVNSFEKAFVYEKIYTFSLVPAIWVSSCCRILGYVIGD